MIGKFDGDNGEIRNLAGIPWRQYLQEKDYNKDINKMCDLCIKEQVKKYGTRTIKCSGLLSADEMVPAQYSHMFSQEERDLMESVIKMSNSDLYLVQMHVIRY